MFERVILHDNIPNHTLNQVKRVLVICGDAWHPAEIVRCGLESLCPDDWQFEFLGAGSSCLPDVLPEFPLVILAKANMVSAADQRPWLTPDVAVVLRSYLRRGNGLMVIHGGTSRYETSPVMNSMIGSAFVSHPRQCDVAMKPVSNHSLTSGVESFTVFDEHYFMSPVSEDAEVFLRSRSAHGLQPAGWTRAEGKGRVCVLTPGHNLVVWQHPEFQKLLLNALRWAAKLN